MEKVFGSKKNGLASLLKKRKPNKRPNNQEHYGSRGQNNESDNTRNKRESKSQNKIQKRISNSLMDSKYRMLNELLYTCSSESAQEYFAKNSKDFFDYHEGYREQIQTWPVKPIDLIIQELTKNRNMHRGIVCDLGCGDGQLYEHFASQRLIQTPCPEDGVTLVSQEPKKKFFTEIKSFDLVPAKPYVQIADAAKLPVKSFTAHVAVFSLSLMGTNYIDFILEANRIIHQKGYLVIAEVLSRLRSPKLFVQMIKSLGYRLVKYRKPNSFFILFIFKKLGKSKEKEKLTRDSKISLKKDSANALKKDMGFLKFFKDKPLSYLNFSQYLLKPCLYKKR